MKSEMLARVIQIIAETTRYPVEVLTPQADLENDLGIDSVKRLEIVVALGDEFDLPLDQEQRDPSLRTIEQIAGWVNGIAQKSAPAEVSSAIRQSVSPPVAPATGLPMESTGGPSFEVSPNRFEPSHHSVPKPLSSQADSSVSAPQTQATNQNVSRRRPLEGKVALVTGAGRSVGRTVARLLADRGATVIVNSFHSRQQGEQTVAEINAAGGTAIHLWGSVAQPSHVDGMFDQIEQRFGHLDILVCNASDGKIGSFMDLQTDDWDRAFRTNVSGHHQCAVRAAPLMRRRGGGSIVTMSAVGSDGFIDGLGSQGVVKAAVETMTRYLACQLGSWGIRANCVVGGPIYGELLNKFPNAAAAQHHWESITPDGELCHPIDIANAIGFLVSDDARGINGSIWNVDHGFSANADGRPSRMNQPLQRRENSSFEMSMASVNPVADSATSTASGTPAGLTATR